MSVPASKATNGILGRVIAVVVTATTSLVVVLSMTTADELVHAAVRPVADRSWEGAVGPVSAANLVPAVRADTPSTVAETSPDVTSPDVTIPGVTIPDVTAPAQSSVDSAPATEPAVVNQSTCRGDLEAPVVMTITIADIAYSCPVYAGGQATLNEGAVAQITVEALRDVLADHPGGPGVLWFAGHRTSHGGPFAAVPDLADGARITVTDGVSTAIYQVVGRVRVGIRNDRVIDATGHATGAATLDSIIRADHGGNGASRLLLQTCDGDNYRWMLYADLVAS